MRYYLKKLAISGAISATFFAVFFYFVYAVESEKYTPATAASEKAYAEETVSEVNSIVAQAIEQEVAKGGTRVAQAPVIQRITAAPSQALAAPAPTSVAALPDIPSIPSAFPSSAPITVPSLPTIAIPTIPAPTPAPAPTPRTTITTTPAPPQPKPAPAPAPRTTVS